MSKVIVACFSILSNCYEYPTLSVKHSVTFRLKSVIKHKIIKELQSQVTN